MFHNSLKDNLLYIDGKAVRVIEAKNAGTTLSGVEKEHQLFGDDFSTMIEDLNGAL